MREYHIVKMKTPDWQRVTAAELTHTGWLPPCDIRARAQLCHDGENLYVRMEAEESDIRAELSQPLDPVCQDSCLEFFIAPLDGDARYFNFEFNPLGNVYLGFGKAQPQRIRLLPQVMEQFCPRPFYTEKGWGITYVIPGEFLRMFMPEFSFSGAIAGNFYKCGDKTVLPHYLAWSELSCHTPQFHRRQDFGKLIFD